MLSRPDSRGMGTFASRADGPSLIGKADSPRSFMEMIPMRRPSIALVPLVLMMMLVAGHAVVAEARAPSPVVDVKRAWIVVDGAAAEAAFAVTCRPVDEPVVLSAELAKDGATDPQVRGKVYGVECTGVPTRVIMPLTRLGGSTIRPGGWVVRYSLTNCLERAKCFTVTGRRHRDLERQRFVTPYDDDNGAELTLRTARVTSAGDVRLVYDVSCDFLLGMPTTIQTYVWQVQRGALVGGRGVFDHGGPGGLDCHPETQRLRYTVPAPDGASFRPRRAFVDSDYGEWYEWGQYATDRHPLRLQPPPSRS